MSSGLFQAEGDQRWGDPLRHVGHVRDVGGHSDQVFTRIIAGLDPMARVPRARDSDQWMSLVLASCDYPAALDRVTSLYPCDERSAMFTPPERMSSAQLLTLGLVNAMTGAWHGLDHVRSAAAFLSERTGPVSAGSEWMVVCAIRTLLLANRVDEAAEHADAAHRVMGEHSSRGWRARIASLRALAALLQGDVRTAVDLSERSLRSIQPQRWGSRIGEPLACAVLGNIALGRIGAAAHHLRTAPPELLGESSHSLWYRYALGHFCLHTGDPRGAVTWHMSCGRSLVEWGMPLEHLYHWRLSAAAAYQVLGEQDVAAHLVDAVLQSRVDEFREEAEESGVPVRAIFRAARELTLSLLTRHSADADFCLTLHRAHDQPPGWEAARPSGAPDERQRAPFLSALTDSELKVAHLAREGKQNKMIARELSITISTVEQHLTRAYRKLGIRTRRELRLVLG